MLKYNLPYGSYSKVFVYFQRLHVDVPPVQFKRFIIFCWFATKIMCSVNFKAMITTNNVALNAPIFLSRGEIILNFF